MRQTEPITRHEIQTASITRNIETTPRLVVLVPFDQPNPGFLARRAWELANVSKAQITFTGLCMDEVQEFSLRRQLATMCAIANSDSVIANSEILHDAPWAYIIRSRRRAGDVLVCTDDSKLLGQIRRANLDIPLQIISGCESQEKSKDLWIRPTAMWLGSALIMLAFFLLQIQVVKLPGYWPTTLQLASLPITAWLLWSWNSLTG